MTASDYAELFFEMFAIFVFFASLALGLFGKDREARVEYLLKAVLLAVMLTGGELSEVGGLLERIP